MIDTLPLDLFGEDESPAPQRRQMIGPTVACPWCAAEVAPDARTCPACEARIPPAEPPTPAPHAGICQWCGATIEPEDDTCPACGWDARGGNEIEMPGITTPLSENQIRSLYGGDDEDDDTGDAIALAADLIGIILPK